MAPSPFRSTAVVCSIVTASLGFGLLAPTVATAATPTPAASSSPTLPDLNQPVDSIPVDPELDTPHIVSIVDTTAGSRSVMGFAGYDQVALMAGETIVGNWGAGMGMFQIFAIDKYRDDALDLVRIHTAADGTKTRTERMALPLTLQVDDLRAFNYFTPGTREFRGTATAGATITATDRDGGELFSVKASANRSAAGTWGAEADLSEGNHAIAFTQTLPDGRKSTIETVIFDEGRGVAPAAPEVRPAERRLQGDFTLWGNVDGQTASVIVRDADGKTIATSDFVTERAFRATVPQDHLGAEVDVFAVAADGTESSAVSVKLDPLPVDADVEAPGIEKVNVLPDGSLQVIGALKKTAGMQVLDGDRVVAYMQADMIGWNFKVDAAYTGKQLDVVALGFNGQYYSATSERVALPRLLKVDGIAEKNTYTPGEHTFTGSAEAGATIVATDQTGKELFRAEAKQTRSGVADWEATADLSSKDGYTVSFTQTTADGRTSEMKGITFTADDEVTAPQDLTLDSHESGGTFVPGPQRFSGTATPGATVSFNPFGFSPQYASYTLTTTADATTGAWTIERGLADVEYSAPAFRQDVEGDVVKEITGVRLSPVATADLVLSSPGDRFTPGTVQTFTGTATPGTKVTLDPFGDSAQYASYRLSTTADEQTGAWTITRPLADSKYLVVLTQEDSGFKVKRIVHPMQPAN